MSTPSQSAGVVGRLRGLSSDGCSTVSHQDLRALLDVVEAAKEHVEIGCDYGHPSDFTSYVRRFDKNYAALEAALAKVL